MKTPLLLFILLLISAGMAQSNSGWRKLSSSQIDKSQLIQDLRQLGHDYTMEKGIFQESPKLPGGYWQIVKTESAYRKITKEVTYYKYTIQTAHVQGTYLVRATYIIAFKPSNGDTRVTFHTYKIISKTYEGPETEDTPTFVDMRGLKKGSNLWKYLDEGIQYTVKDAIAKGLIPKSTYRFWRVFCIQSIDFTNPGGLGYIIQLRNHQGQNYRARIIVWVNQPNQEEVPPDYHIYPNV